MYSFLILLFFSSIVHTIDCLGTRQDKIGIELISETASRAKAINIKTLHKYKIVSLSMWSLISPVQSHSDPPC